MFCIIKDIGKEEIFLSGYSKNEKNLKPSKA